MNDIFALSNVRSKAPKIHIFHLYKNEAFGKTRVSYYIFHCYFAVYFDGHTHQYKINFCAYVYICIITLLNK